MSLTRLALSRSSSAAGAATKLLTVEQVDEALRRRVEYHPPGT